MFEPTLSALPGTARTSTPQHRGVPDFTHRRVPHSFNGMDGAAHCVRGGGSAFTPSPEQSKERDTQGHPPQSSTTPPDTASCSHTAPAAQDTVPAADTTARTDDTTHPTLPGTPDEMPPWEAQLIQDWVDAQTDDPTRDMEIPPDFPIPPNTQGDMQPLTHGCWMRRRVPTRHPGDCPELCARVQRGQRTAPLHSPQGSWGFLAR